MASAQLTVQRVRQAELARILDVSRQSINELVQRQVLSVDKDGLIDVELARLAIAQRMRPSAKTAQGAVAASAATAPAAAVPNVPPPVASFHVAKTLRETTEAKIAQVKLLQLTGKTLDAEEVERLTFTRARIARDAVMAIAPRCYQALAAESDPQKVLVLLKAELRRACAEIAAGSPEEEPQ